MDTAVEMFALRCLLGPALVARGAEVNVQTGLGLVVGEATSLPLAGNTKKVARPLPTVLPAAPLRTYNTQ